MTDQIAIVSNIEEKSLIKKNEKRKEKTLDVFMGIDIGSVSLKIVLLDKNNSIIEKLWLRNQGSPIESSKKGIRELKERLESSGMFSKININSIFSFVFKT